MVLWIAMAVLAAAAALPLLVALGRSPRTAAGEAEAVAIYRDQLGEVSRDVARGVIAADEAEGARIEIARRLIRAGSESTPAAAASDWRRRIAAILVVAMPVAALGLYLLLGSPLDPDQPLLSRPEAVEYQDMLQRVALVEQHLAQVPDDGKGWEVIAPVYTGLGRDADAAHAWSRAIALLGSTAARQASLGQALMTAAGGTVTPDAKAAFERARDLDPADPRPRFYLALALSQSGEKDAASAAWRQLIDTAPPDAQWLPIARMEFAKVAGPEGMVASLAARLKAAPDDAQGWAQLVRSYMVLGRPDDARAALADARTALAADQAKVAIVETAAREAGVEAGQ
ncbi:MAG TPA: c-type cytochrome biogenesis protein CcmI [Bauldia sp.]|nr:c-type cytochrome biogenesis protein CcmI [Bauldia sp.]